MRNLSFIFSVILYHRVIQILFYDVIFEVNILFIALSFLFLFDKTFRKKDVWYDINTFCRSRAAISSICQVGEKDDARIRPGTRGGKNEYSASSITVTTVLSIEDYRFASRNGAAPNEGKEETAVRYRRSDCRLAETWKDKEVSGR